MVIRTVYHEIIPLEGEVFKEYLNYTISNFGRVFNKFGNQICVNITGNRWIQLHFKNGKLEQLHAVVYKLFKGDIPANTFIFHLDRNRKNNHIDNLELRGNIQIDQYKNIIPRDGEIFQKYKEHSVSNFGRVFNKYGEEVCIKKPGSNRYFSIKYKGKQERRCRIIYTLFKGEIPEGLEINHIDGNKWNDHIDNLEVVNRSQNVKHAYNTKLKKKLSWKYTDEIINQVFDFFIKGFKDLEINKITGVSLSYLRYLRNGQSRFDLSKNIIRLWNPNFKISNRII